MSTYKVRWPCCNSVTETDAWSPSKCPICECDELRIALAETTAEPRWKEIPVELGAVLWAGYRNHMIGPTKVISVYATATEAGRAETQIGVEGGNYYLMKLVTTYEEQWTETSSGFHYSIRVNEKTVYYVPYRAGAGRD